MDRHHATECGRAAEAIRAFGFEQPTLTPALLSTPGNIVRMGCPPIRVEVFNEIPGVLFDECHLRRASMTIDGLAIAVISREDLIVNKLATGRAQDRADVEALQRADCG